MTDILKFANAGPADPLFRLESVQDDADSLLTYPGYRMTANEAHRIVTYGQPIGGIGQWGDTIVYEIDKNCFQSGEPYLNMTVPAITQNTAGAPNATFARFVDGVGYALIKKLEVIHGSNDLEKRTAIQYYVEFENKEPEEQLNLSDYIMINKSSAERTTLAGASQNFLIPLATFWSWWSKMYVITAILGTKLQIKIDLAPLNEILVTDGSNLPTVTISAQSLEVMSYYVPESEQQFSIAKTLTDTGLVYRTMQWTTQERLIDNGSTEFSIQLQNFKLPCVEWEFVIIPVASLDVVAPNAALNYRDWILPLDYDLQAGDIEVVKRINCRHWKLYRKRLYYPRAGGMPNKFGWSNSWMPGSYAISAGHKTWNEMTNPTLNIRFTAALTGQHKIIVLSRENNQVAHKGGSLKRILT